MIYCKEGVKITNLQPQIVFALQIIGFIFDKFGYPLTMTSADDGIHGHGTLHGSGKAVDLRSKVIGTRGMKEVILKEMRLVLVPLEFDVILESLGEENEHYHVEYDPK